MIVTQHRAKKLWSKSLYGCQKELEAQYRLYRLGQISEQEYLYRIKPIDMAIGALEMATLRGMPVSKESF